MTAQTRNAQALALSLAIAANSSVSFAQEVQDPKAVFSGFRIVEEEFSAICPSMGERILGIREIKSLHVQGRDHAQEMCSCAIEKLRSDKEFVARYELPQVELAKLIKTEDFKAKTMVRFYQVSFSCLAVELNTMLSNPASAR